MSNEKLDKGAPVGSGSGGMGKGMTGGSGGVDKSAPVAPSKSSTATGLTGAKKNADAGFSKVQKVGAPAGKCPPGTDDRWLKVKWNRKDAYCGDPTTLLGTAKGIKAKTTAGAEVTVKGHGTVASSLRTKGQNSFSIAWKVADVVFKGSKLPEKKPAIGKLSADGLRAETEKALAIKRVPDKTPQAVSYQCSSPKSINGWTDYKWKASFKLGIKDDTLQVLQTLQVKKAWCGRFVEKFDPKADKLKQPWGFVKKAGVQWDYWNESSKAWKKLPCNISKYTLKDAFFIKKGDKFVSRDDGGKFTWPGKFQEPKASDYEQKKKGWLQHIHHVWNKKFVLHREDCASSAKDCCQWKIDVKVNWSDKAGDQLVYLVAGPKDGRSTSSNWFLTGSKETAAHEAGHLLGAYDEYKKDGGAIHPKTKKIDDNSIMGLKLTVAHDRHLEVLRDQAKKKINSWTGRSWKFEIKKV